MLEKESEREEGGGEEETEKNLLVYHLHGESHTTVQGNFMLSFIREHVYGNIYLLNFRFTFFNCKIVKPTNTTKKKKYFMGKNQLGKLFAQ